MRTFSGSEQFDELTKQVTGAYSKLFPAVKEGHTLELNKIWLDDKQMDINDFPDQKKTKLAGKTWGAPVFASLTLKDPQGKVLDKLEKVRLATIPKLTPRGSYIVGGNEYQVANQMIRKPGSYVVRSQQGEPKGMVTLQGERTQNFEVHFDPGTNKYTAKFNQAYIPLYPLLKSLGAQDSELIHTWGEKIFNANKLEKDSDYFKYADKLARVTVDNKTTAMEAIKAFANTTKVDPEVTKMTLGTAHAALSSRMLLDTTKKILSVYQGKAETDDPENLLFKEIRSVEDMIHDKLNNKREQDNLKRMLTRNLGRRTEIKKIVDFRKLTAPVEAFFTSDDRSGSSEQYNPVHMLAESSKLTIHGTGGIQSEHAVSESLREVHPSHVGFVDATHSPESGKIGTTLHLTAGVIKDGRNIRTMVKNLRTGKMEHLTPQELYFKNVAFPDELVDGSFKDPKNVRIQSGGKIDVVSATKVDYALADPLRLFSYSSNLIPFLKNDQGTRAMMAAKHLGQAIPLVEREAPLVQTELGKGITFQKLIGEQFSIKSPHAGTVKSVGHDHIQIDGTKIPLYDNFPLNQKTSLHHNAVVKVGDKVKEGQLLCDSNFTRGGELAIGKNLNVAYIPYPALTFEDGVVLTESGAKKLAAEQIYKHSFDLEEGRKKLDFRYFVRTYPNLVARETVKDYDNTGVIKKGAVVKPGQMIIAGLNYNLHSPENASLKKINKSLTIPWGNASVNYQGEFEGTVTDVVKRADGIQVYIKAIENAKESDKISGVHGNKGVCFDAATEILTNNGWKLFKNLSQEDLVCSRDLEGNINFEQPTRYISYEYKGKMYKYSGRRLNLCTTPEHNHFVRTRRKDGGITLRQLEPAKNCFGKVRIHSRTGKWTGSEILQVIVPGIPEHAQKKFRSDLVLEADVFMEFFGYWITEGCAEKRRSHITIAQRRAVHPKIYDDIKQCLIRLGFKPYEGKDALAISEPRLNRWLRQFGLSKSKFIPRSLMGACGRQLKLLVAAAFAGDGGVYFREKDNHTRYELFTGSKRLADDYQELAFKLGCSANIKIHERLERGKNRRGDDQTEYIVRWSFKDEVWTNNDKRYDNESWIKYDGMVYCVEVPSHVIYVRRNGIPVWSGNCTKVIPDSEAPRTKEGKIPDVILNPHGIISRINLGQIYESAAGKIAEKTGKPYIVKNFDSEDTNKKIVADMIKHGLDDREEMFSPDGKSLGKVHIGKPYILRLAKTGKTGFSARIPGQGYDINLQPVRGGETGTKSLDQLTLFSMLSHGAKKNLIDAHYKSEKNDEYWHAIETGQPVPAPQPTFAYNKFISLLKGAGINTEKQGSNIVLGAMTDKDTLKISKGKIEEPEFLYAKNLKPMKGGFFDVVKTGGLQGKNYTHIEMHDRLPNPIFEGAIKSITGLKQDQYDSIIAGSTYLHPDGRMTSEMAPGAKTGGGAIAHMLDQIDIDKELISTKAALRKAVISGKVDADIDKLNRRVRYMSALKDLNMMPSEAYTRKHIPVVPPIYRPVQEIQGMSFQVAPANLLYQNVGILNKSATYPVMDLLHDSEKTNLKAETYNATKQLAGLEDVHTRGKAQPIQGFVSQITGSSPKQGFFLNRLISKRQDLVGRAVITTSPDLHMDELGVPEKMAWKIFRPFVVREMTASGFKPDIARKEIDDETPQAKKYLETVMNKRTVMINRAPSLHKFAILAFKPKLTTGLAIQLPPLVFKGLGADLDGDAVTCHVPVSEAALRESVKMFPSNNLFKPGTGELMTVPSQEAAIGVYYLSQTEKGRAQINKVLPAKFHVTAALDAKSASKMYNQIAHEDPQHFPNIVHEIKQLGDQHAYDIGFTAGLKDIIVNTKGRDELFHKADTEVAALKKAHKPGQELDNKVAAIYQAAAKNSFTLMNEQMKKNNSSFYHMLASGARGNSLQLQQMISAPGIVSDSKDRPIPVPIKKSYAEGLSTSDYFVSAYGVRKGMMDRALQTMKPGALNKELMASVIDNIVTAHDCGATKGLEIPINSNDTQDRYLAKDQHGFHRNAPITPDMISALKKQGVTTINARSPLRCMEPKGTCALCYGNDEHGQPPVVGENIGAKAGQTMSEPLTQFVMRTFHTGGVAGGAQVSGFTRINQLLKMQKTIPHEATVAEVAGKVTKIAPSPAGGHEVYIGAEVHTVHPGLNLKVKIGDAVAPGDLLSEGILKPQTLLKHKGMQAAQNYIVDELQKTYQQQGVPMQRKILETTIRSVANSTRVVEAPKSGEFLPGDIIPYNTAVHYNETRKVAMDPHAAIGYKLSQQLGTLPQFHEVTEKDAAYLKGAGHGKIEVIKDPLVHAPMLRGINQIPLMRKDWMAQMGFQHIKDALTEGAAQRWESNVAGSHPIPAFAYGATFGQKKETY